MEYIETHRELIRLEKRICDGRGSMSDAQLVAEFKELLKLASEADDIQPVIKRKSKCDYCNDSGSAPFKTGGKCPICQ